MKRIGKLAGPVNCCRVKGGQALGDPLRFEKDE
jgi:hypothetical protein